MDVVQGEDCSQGRGENLKVKVSYRNALQGQIPTVFAKDSPNLEYNKEIHGLDEWHPILSEEPSPIVELRNEDFDIDVEKFLSKAVIYRIWGKYPSRESIDDFINKEWSHRF